MLERLRVDRESSGGITLVVAHGVARHIDILNKGRYRFVERKASDSIVGAVKVKQLRVGLEREALQLVVLAVERTQVGRARKVERSYALSFADKRFELRGGCDGDCLSRQRTCQREVGVVGHGHVNGRAVAPVDLHTAFQLVNLQCNSLTCLLVSGNLNHIVCQGRRNGQHPCC